MQQAYANYIKRPPAHATPPLVNRTQHTPASKLSKATLPSECVSLGRYRLQRCSQRVLLALAHWSSLLENRKAFFLASLPLRAAMSMLSLGLLLTSLLCLLLVLLMMLLLVGSLLLVQMQFVLGWKQAARAASAEAAGLRLAARRLLDDRQGGRGDGAGAAAAAYNGLVCAERLRAAC